MQPGQYVVGQLYRDGYINGQKVYTQPGGIGTRVYPQLPQSFPWFGGQNRDNIERDGIYSWPASYPAQYYFGCGHPLNCPSIQQAYDPYNEVQVILLLCPMCGYIQEIYSPASIYYNYLETPIVVD